MFFLKKWTMFYYFAHFFLLCFPSDFVSKKQLIEKYNDAVQEIWFLSERSSQLYEENETLWKANEELMDQLYVPKVCP